MGCANYPPPFGKGKLAQPLKGGAIMTAQDIIAYLEAELNEAINLHDEATDKALRLSLMLKAYTISELLDHIKA